MSKEDYFTEEEMAGFMRIAIGTLQNLRYSGKNHPPYIKVGRKILYPKDLAKRWCNERVVYSINRAS